MILFYIEWDTHPLDLDLSLIITSFSPIPVNEENLKIEQFYGIVATSHFYPNYELL